MQKAGFVAVVGRPNAGKSTLLNELCGEKLAMVSKKAQATRKRMNIIVMHENTQIVFIDTPGLHEKERLLNRYMMEEAVKAIGDADLILYLAPVTDKLDDYKKFLQLEKVEKVPHIIVLTKVDLVDNAAVLRKIKEYQKYQEHFLSLFPYSAKKDSYRKLLLDEVAKSIPLHPWYYDPELITTESVRTIYKELIREAVFDKLSDEIPYESDVVIEDMSEDEKIDKVSALIIVEKDTQKRMIIGKGGESIKRLGTVARRSMERFAGKRIFLDIRVIVRRGWSKNRRQLEEIGYIF